MTLFDAGAFTNPLIGGVNKLFQVMVGDDVFGQIATCAGYAGIDDVTTSSAWLK